MSWIPERSASEILDVHPKTLRRWAVSGVYKIGVSKVSRKYLYKESDIKKVIDDHQINKKASAATETL